MNGSSPYTRLARVSPPSKASMRLRIMDLAVAAEKTIGINRCSQNREGEHYARNGCGITAENIQR